MGPLMQTDAAPWSGNLNPLKISRFWLVLPSEIGPQKVKCQVINN
jgi:hypothetical protein